MEREEIAADLYSAVFWGANLDGANLSRANMESVWLDGVKLTNVNLTVAINFWIDGGAIFDNTIMPDGTIRTD
ncbi:pentapeptide repeat family protein [Calothrix parasitica NIES-267]|uniref:Pentapeptide repeat family protein n=1 Tax=Calothrix parasitica NIES-267 TaxID=1973488 RepID=A0A1Z4LJ64_9CYAN|nr:pentapeptide repeat family protein [Calothrix parasitica NIES-267]